MLSMQPRRHRLFGGLALGLSCLGGGLSCGSANRAGLGPDVSLASSVEAQSMFRTLREQWTSTAPDARIGLERPLTTFIQRFPQDSRAPQARIFMGQSYAIEGKHTQAAAEFQKVVDTYRNAPEVPEAMWLLSQSFVELKFCSDARVLLQDLEKRYPRSGRIKDVKVKLRELQKIGRDKRLCTS